MAKGNERRYFDNERFQTEIDPFTWWEEIRKSRMPLTREHVLWAMVVRQAIEDAVGNATPCTFQDKDIQLIRTGAIQWILYSYGTFSFPWICQLFGLNADFAKGIILKKYAVRKMQGFPIEKKKFNNTRG